MRPSGDYSGEMPTTKVLDREIELLLAGRPIEGGRLSGLAPVMEMIRTQWTPAPSESEIAHFARSRRIGRESDAIRCYSRHHSPATAGGTPARSYPASGNSGDGGPPHVRDSRHGPGSQ